MFELIIGLEVHTQLNTKTKLFCNCKTSFGEKPNKNTCPVCIGLPGALPVLNKEAVIKAMTFGNAVNSTINNNSIFERKNYFYPDLPTGYQISQLEIPIVEFGEVIIKDKEKNDKVIRLNRAHLETDAGKNIHGSDNSLVDLNRSGIPLLEIVTEPDFRSSEEVTSYLKQLHSIVKYINISDANMQEGSFRCDVNVSIRPKGDKKLYTRCEIKNLNSFKFIEKAIAYEYQRQVEAWEDGVYEEEVFQETRLFDTTNFVTKSMRSKEEAMDYRYFPDPDLKEVTLTKDMYEKAKELPELPREKYIRYKNELEIPELEIERLIQSPILNKIFEEIIEKDKKERIKPAISILMVELPNILKEYSTELLISNISIKQIKDLIDNIVKEVISMGAIKKVLPYLLKNNTISPIKKTSIILKDTISNKECEEELKVKDVLGELNLLQISDENELSNYIEEVLNKEKEKVEEYKNGKEKLFGSFVGKIMKATQGKGNPQIINKILKQKLKG